MCFNIILRNSQNHAQISTIKEQIGVSITLKKTGKTAEKLGQTSQQIGKLANLQTFFSLVVQDTGFYLAPTHLVCFAGPLTGTSNLCPAAPGAVDSPAYGT
jgi:hypothetical protein